MGTNKGKNLWLYFHGNDDYDFFLEKKEEINYGKKEKSP